MSAMLRPNQHVAGYEVFELVGKGGMGEVYRARQISMDRPVALKVLAFKLAKQDPSFAKRFVDEAQAAGRLNNPHIISVHDVGKASLAIDDVEQDLYYFSMEYVDGETLKMVIEREGPCPAQLIARVMDSMAEALVYAESMGVVHRDIKPDNIMVSSSGAVKLADLGLAQQVGGEAGLDDKDANGKNRVMGTPMYMSPEQARGISVDHRSDQYSLGATLYHMLTGQPPYRGENAKAIMQAHVFQPVPDPATVGQAIPEGWRTICMKLMAKKANDRYANARDLRTAVKAAISGQAVGVSRRLRSNKSARLDDASGKAGIPPLVAFLVGLAIVAGGGMVLSMLFFGNKTTPSPTPVIEPKPIVEDKTKKAALANAQNAIATLPKEARQALARLDTLLADPGSADPEVQALLKAERAKRQAEYDEEAKRGAAQKRLEDIDRLIGEGKLAQANDALSALAKEGATPEADALGKKLREAVQNAQGALLAALGKAARVEDIDAALAQARALPISNDERGKIEAAAQARRDALKQGEKPAPPKQVAETILWRDFGKVVKQFQHTTRYKAFKDTVAKEASKFANQESRDAAMRFSELAGLAQEGDGYLRMHVKSKNPKALLPGNRLVKLVDLTDDDIFFQPSSDTGAPDTKSVPRAGIDLPFKKFLDEHLRNLPADQKRNNERIKASFLWIWDPDEARPLFDKLGEDPLAKAVLSLESRAIGLHGAAKLEQSTVAVTYDFTGKDPALLQDFIGGGSSFSDRGLQWKADRAVPDGAMTEDVLPTLKWIGKLKPPVDIQASILLNRDMMTGLVGVQGNSKLLRLGFNPSKPGLVGVKVLYTNDNGHFMLAQNQKNLPFNLSLPISVHFTVDASYKCTAVFQLPDGQPVTMMNQYQLPVDAPIEFVLQAARKNEGQVLEVATLTLTGQLLE